MKITFNETEKCVEIKDGLKNHFLLMKALMILNLWFIFLIILHFMERWKVKRRSFEKC